MAAVDDVYVERNDVVLAFAALAVRSGWQVGVAVDEGEPDWPVLLIDTPMGQVSWHFAKGALPSEIPPYDGEWDGHETPEKYERLRRYVAATWGDA